MNEEIYDQLIKALPDPYRLRLIADWMDMIDEERGTLHDDHDEVQRWLRRKALNIEQVLEKVNGVN